MNFSAKAPLLNDVPPVGGMMLLPCGRNDAMFAIIVPEGDASLPQAISLAKRHHLPDRANIIEKDDCKKQSSFSWWRRGEFQGTVFYYFAAFQGT